MALHETNLLQDVQTFKKFYLWIHEEVFQLQNKLKHLQLWIDI